VAHHGDRVLADAVEHGQGVAYVGVPGVELGVLGVAVAALVPTHDPVACIRQERGKDVEGAGEVEAAVGQQKRRGLELAPLVDGETQPVGVHLAGAVRCADSRIGDGLRLGGARAQP
jgi:hypothetical protein